MFKFKKKRNEVRYTTKMCSVYVRTGEEYKLVKLVNKKISELEKDSAQIVDIFPYTGTEKIDDSYATCVGFRIVSQKEMEIIKING